MNDSVDNQFEDLSLNHINLPYIDPGEFIAANVYLFIYSTCYELFLLFFLKFSFRCSVMVLLAM